ncbi:MAG: tRNA (adenosine(37)-N6)-threonylcarbamoyltransferase complex ATPase subunit type 1 TsaE [Treponema sp.]|nr:tRNA (adenosine(37)-N6)-threonylcarbamoyltransferase complex ATPase subunit type 1 TsaE [Treponema sp.]
MGENSLISNGSGIICASPQETAALGERIAASLVPGSVVALYGSLGSGKTCLAGGIARALGIGEIITSPTYTIISVYPGSLNLYHIDAYRLTGEEEFEQLGIDELVSENGVVLIEWAEKVEKSLPADTIKIFIEIAGTEKRLIRVCGLEPAP